MEEMKKNDFDKPKKDLFGSKKVGTPDSNIHIRKCNAVEKLRERKNFIAQK